uniref:MRP-S28 domain-containing protein n=1 Tax=Parastrongyloides trichosuri TaxID=131310 RepID=A0A0N4ZJB0_PARTI
MLQLKSCISINKSSSSLINILQSIRFQSTLSNVNDNQLDDNEFRECFVKPNRKLRAQTMLERMTGRGDEVKRIRYDLKERIKKRSPRSEEMDPNQDWSSVWPAAQSFKASVVPLPIRMGTRPDPARRPPPSKFGNLELVKIPNFLHLTPGAVEKHCDAIKKFCTPFPKELKEDPSLVSKLLPLSIEYSDYIHQGPSLRDPRAKKIAYKVKVESLKLSPHGKEKLMRLVGNRYDTETDILTIETERCYTRKQNLDYGIYLLTVLRNEAEKVEAWENLKGPEDSMEAKFVDIK